MTSNFVPLILAGPGGLRQAPSAGRNATSSISSTDAAAAMLQRTVDRLGPLAPPAEVRIIGAERMTKIVQQRLPSIVAEHLICEPVSRNTAPACGLMAFLLARTTPDAVLGVFPMDHEVTDTRRFASLLREGIELAQAPDRIVLLGVPPTRPATRYGYIETATSGRGVAQAVRSFKEKPDADTAAAFLLSGRYLWHSGVLLATPRTLCDAIREHAPTMAASLEAIAEARGTPHFTTVFRAIFHSCEDISIDRAVLEPRAAQGEHANMCCIPADIGWSDVGGPAYSPVRRTGEYTSDESEEQAPLKTGRGSNYA